MVNPEAYGRVDALLVAALELPPGERDAFLDTACGGDAALRQQLELLIAGSEQRTLEKSAFGLLRDSSPASMGDSSARPDSRQPVNAPETLSSDSFRPGKVLAGRFRVVRFIARGGMGEVYEAIDLELQEPVALKTLPLDRTDDERALERFRREIQLARKVTHPNVCRVYDVFRHRDGGSGGPARGEITFLSMELLGGGTLTDHIRRFGRIDPREALPIVTQMAAGLEAAHEAGVIHRDFKSGNVMLLPPTTDSKPPRVVITDFSLARAMQPSATLTETGAFIGTPAYMAPEQITGGDVTSATDIYAFGIVLYEMLTASHPFVAETAIGTAFKRLTEPPPSPRRVVPDLDPRWEQVVLRCLSREAGNRFTHATEISEALGGGPGPSPGADKAAATTAGANHVLEPGPTEPIRVGSAVINPDLGPLRERLLLAHSSNELTRLKYEVEQYLATRPTDVEGRILRDEVEHALTFEAATQTTRLTAVDMRPSAKRAPAPFWSGGLRYAVGGVVGVLAIAVMVRVGWDYARLSPSDLPTVMSRPAEVSLPTPGSQPPATTATGPSSSAAAPPPPAPPAAELSPKALKSPARPPNVELTLPPPETAAPPAPSSAGGANSTVTSTGLQPIAAPTKEAAPEHPETTARRLIQALLDEYCASREAMSAARVQKIWPSQNLATLRNQFLQFKSIRCTLQGMPEYVTLDYDAGKATVKIGVRQILDQKVGGVTRNETTMTADVSRPAVGADYWIINTVRHEPAKK